MKLIICEGKDLCLPLKLQELEFTERAFLL